MKKVVLLAAVIAFCFSANLKAQAVKIDKAGCVLTKEDSSKEYFLENTTNDTIKVIVVNHQEKVEDMGNGAIAVSSGEHAEITFQIPPKTKVSLEYKICIHSTGLLFGSTEPSNLLEYKFMQKNNSAN